MSSSDISLLSHSLHQLQVQQETLNHIDDEDADARTRDDYGFRKSGISTPLSGLSRIDNVVPDPNGLGWPGEWSFES
jgi:GTP cyclohydrolase IA